ncbi:hypothetical protein BTHE68_28590 [Burkholderia sp. THE68]|uniref:hypothetical protein n=1 Tax=Burkholderia sp. THE68 TaxID=758782 RepID=UPI0013189FD2|nr:hypothetical protein [Burkholderia sp. THE68]BBU29125.1 hypothetical protein BTHE68_28590 [Burkholderia sp. THE68]
MSDALAGALCVLAALSAGASMRADAARSRGLWAAGAVLIVACGAGGASGAMALSLAVVAGCVGFRFGRGAANTSTQALFATIAFAAWVLPSANSAYAVLAGGAVGALVHLAGAWARRRESVNLQPLHLVCAGACAALAYVLGAQSGALSVVSVIAMVALIGAHLSLAMSGRAGVPVASLLSGLASCGLAATAAFNCTHGALAVAAVALAIGCARTAAVLGVARETP